MTTPAHPLIHRPIRCLLVANRGEIAARIAATARRLGLGVVGVFTEHDRGAFHVGACDRAVLVSSYLDGAALVAAAQRMGCDAVHPGYGFLAENAGVAALVCAAGLVWVGPPPAAIAAMGSKTAARETMVAYGVPVVPGTAGHARTDIELMEAAREIGLPVLVKASAGGGGKGMRVVERLEDLPGALAEARRLALAAFGDGEVFLERYLPRARHIEVQVLADAHGAVTHLWERECSLQRRHQKVIEEAPSPAFFGATGEELRQRLCADAMRAAAAVGYVGAGTVEFLFQDDETGGQHWFLEMNTRIQVEHPVTELVTGLDLVELQLRVAAGEPLDPSLAAGLAPRNGWAMEARIYAEDPDNGYRPSVGRLLAWRPPDGVRVDAGVREGSEVGSHYDPMLAKIVAWGPARDVARTRLVTALQSLVALGVTTNRSALLRVLDHPAFVSGDLHTRFLDEHAAVLGPRSDTDFERHARIAVVVFEALSRRGARTLLPGLPAGWRNNRWRDPVVRFRAGEGTRDIAWRETAWGWQVDGLDVRLVEAGTPLFLEIDGLVQPWFIASDGATRWVHGPRETQHLELLPEVPETDAADAPEGAGGLLAPMPGRIVAVPVAVGQTVRAGDVLVVIEAMKMEQAVRAPVDGVVSSVRVAVGDQVDGGALLVELAPDEGG